MSNPRTRVVVVGGGICGATAALHLARSGAEVVLVEGGAEIGGLVSSFSVGGTPLERFYHHVFPHEDSVLALIDQLGLTPRLGWYPSTVGVLRDGRVWPFTTPLDLLRFGPLPLVDRLHMGIGALRLQRVRDWAALDAVPAVDWLREYTGDRAVDVVWGPLLGAKFGPAARQVPAAWMWGRFQQRAGARRGKGESLGYLRGGFHQLFVALDAELRRLGATMRLGARVDHLVVDNGVLRGVSCRGDTIEADQVVYAGSLPGLSRLLPPELHDPRWTAAEGLGVLCVVLETTRSLGPVYWTNVCDANLPFGGVIEHTNLVPADDYGGRHVVYLSRYFTADEPVAAVDPDAEAVRWVDDLRDVYSPRLDDALLAVHAFRAGYAAPLVTAPYAERIPPLVSHLPGLHVATTAQIYPQDRGMDEGVRGGAAAARSVLAQAAGAA